MTPEEEICELILENAHVLTCFNCGGTLGSQTKGIPNDTRVGILHIDPGEMNYPREPDIPASAYFECMQCYERDRIEDDVENDCTVKKCCLICDHAVVDDIDDMDNLIPCHCRENMKHGGSPCMEQDDVCKYFVLNSLLTPE